MCFFVPDPNQTVNPALSQYNFKNVTYRHMKLRQKSKVSSYLCFAKTYIPNTYSADWVAITILPYIFTWTLTTNIPMQFSTCVCL